MKATDTSDLTPEQRAKLAYALEIIRSTQGNLRGWTQSRGPNTLFLIKRHSKTAAIEQAYHVCRDAPLR